MASVATSEWPTEVGVKDVGITAGVTVAAATGLEGRHGNVQSEDGGLSWIGASIDGNEIRWGGESAETPRGRYVIQGPDIVLFGADGGPELAYSTAYMQEEGNVWVQEHATARLDEREATTAPRHIVYEERSGNLIVAMGIQGVVVGTPDGVWTRHTVGRYSPVDFSFSGKTGLLLSNGGFWAAALALSLSMTGMALVLSQYRREGLPLLAVVALATVALLIALHIVLLATGFGHLLGLILVVLLSSGPFMILVLIGGAIALGFVLKEGGGEEPGIGDCYPFLASVRSPVACIRRLRRRRLHRLRHRASGSTFLY